MMGKKNIKTYESWGEVTAFFALFLDNVGVLVFFSSILIFTFNYPADIILTHMIPGTAMGICVGDLVYTYLAIRLGKMTGRRDVTAMPLGIDTPSTIGLAYAVIGPVFTASGDAKLAWQVGMATLFLIGLVKVITSFFGGWIQRLIPTAGLLGPLGGIGLLLLGFLPLMELFNEVMVGMVALGLIFTSLMSRLRLPGNFPGVLAAVILGTVLHFGLGFSGYLTEFSKPTLDLRFSPPKFSFEFLSILPESWQYLTLAIPFGLLTIVGGINNTESARLAGDDYRTRDILLTEALSSLFAPFFGGVAQTTPYIGHPAYKKMGASWLYTLLTALFIGLCSFVGLLSLLVSLIPRAVIAPIFIFIGFEIIRQAYQDSPPAHLPAVSFSMLPVVASLVLIIMNQFTTALNANMAHLPLHLTVTHQTLVMLSNGFIITGLLWGSMLTYIIDRRPRPAAFCALICAALALFGFIHSFRPTGELYLPWQVETTTPFLVALAYLLLAGIFTSMKEKR
ncbi:MAG TPA: hypothetical protein PLT64_09695 [Syntrophales bacterium]|nr:hypothetical protein [Syntrophales bacterium]HOL60117.1 hypothetical protein [Syntrophales bacterium]HPO36198.1 hypothetical protein [Syntrophales bacterium]